MILSQRNLPLRVMSCHLLSLQVKTMADGVLHRLKSEGADMIRSPSARPTVRQLSSLLWALGDKGMHANADDGWTAAVGRLWRDAVLHSAVSVTALSYSRVSIVLTFPIALMSRQR